MARSRSKIAAVPTVLVAAAGGRRGGRRLPHVTLPGPLGSRRRRKNNVMRVAKNAAAVVSAMTVVLDVASQVSSLKESMADRSGENPAPAPRKSSSAGTAAKKRPANGGRSRQSNGASGGAAKAHASSSANGSANRRKD